MAAKLGVNVDHVATLREARRTKYPDPVMAVFLAEGAGADSIIVHLREDRRHIKERDLKILRNTVKTVLNLEMAATEDMVKIALYIKPDMVTLVPERREELTTEGGLDVIMYKDSLARKVEMLKEGDIRVNTFIDPDIDQIKGSDKINADGVEIHTGRYCDAAQEGARIKELNRIIDAVKIASKLNLRISAGHGLDYSNIKGLIGIPEIEEFNIGHSIISRAVMVGIDRAVREMVMLIRGDIIR